MAIEHVNITDPNIHEPKGVAAAAAGTAYVANGSGSGAWRNVSKGEYACMHCTSTATTGITTAFLPLNTASVGGTVTWVENIASSGITTDTASGYMQVAEAGVFELNLNVSFLASTNPSTFTFTIGVDSGLGIVEQSTSVQAILATTRTSETSIITLLCLPSLSAGDKIYPLVKEAAGNELTVQFCNMTIKRAN